MVENVFSTIHILNNRDATTLHSAQQLKALEDRVMKRCPVCQRRYGEAKQFCTRDGTPLSESDLSEASRVVNYCKLCNKFYPQADGICPIHGIPIAEELSDPEHAPKTREIEKTQKTLVTSMRILGFNSDDRRLVTTLATLTVLLLLSLGIYSLTRPNKSENSGSYEDLTSSNTPPPEESDRQLIELAGNPSAEVEPDTPSLTKTSKQKPSTAQAQISSEESVSTTTSHTNDNTTRSKNQATTETSSTPTAPSQTAPPPTASPTQGASVTDRSAEATPSSKPGYSRTTNHPRVHITGKTRREVENGYVYEFDLVINGATGIKWHSVSGSKVTYGGHSTPIKTAQLEPTRDGSLRYHVSVRMTGSSVEDWYGQVYTTTIGTDEEGRTVRIEQDIFLDDSFPVVQKVTR